jgi:hypothetical protein
VVTTERLWRIIPAGVDDQVVSKGSACVFTRGYLDGDGEHQDTHRDDLLGFANKVPHIQTSFFANSEFTGLRIITEL